MAESQKYCGIYSFAAIELIVFVNFGVRFSEWIYKNRQTQSRYRPKLFIFKVRMEEL